MRGLTIHEPHLTYILTGRKDWEIRTTNTNIRERIGLVRAGASEIAGFATLSRCFPLERKILSLYKHRHWMWNEDLARYGDKKKPLYVWTLIDIESLAEPIAFTRKPGSVNWVTLPDTIV